MADIHSNSHDLANALNGLSDQALASKLGVSLRTLPRYRLATEAFSTIPPGAQLSPAEFSIATDFSAATSRTIFEKIVTAEPRLFSLTAEFLPQVECMMDLVQIELGGEISSHNLEEANSRCSTIVESVLKPRLARFLNDSLPHHINENGDYVLSLADMLTFLMGDYQVFNKAQGAGLVSRAGGYNEGILKRALSNSGMVEGEQFQKTGQNSDGDLAIYCRKTKPNEALWVEIKSYGARERLLRGLHDCSVPKIGVGFFNTPSEFNPGRTVQLMATQALAIYMPKSTYLGLHPDSAAMTNPRQSPFYRPLEEFVSDVQAFSHRGVKAYDK